MILYILPKVLAQGKLFANFCFAKPLHFGSVSATLRWA